MIKKGDKKDDWILSKEYNPKLAIIDNTTWECSSLKKAERDYKRNQEKKKSIYKEEDFLFRGFLRCKGCGSLLTPQTLRREKELRRQKNKTKVYYFHSYVCGRNSINGCSNDQRHFSVTQCEETILSLICDYINTIKNKSFYKHISNKKNKAILELDKKQNKIKKSLTILQKEKAVLSDEIIKSIVGESKYNSNQLSCLLDSKENEVEEITQGLNSIITEKELLLAEFRELDAVYNLTTIWNEEFEKADFQDKKILLSKILDVVYLSKNNIEVKFIVNILL